MLEGIVFLLVKMEYRNQPSLSEWSYSIIPLQAPSLIIVSLGLHHVFRSKPPYRDSCLLWPKTRH